MTEKQTSQDSPIFGEGPIGIRELLFRGMDGRLAEVLNLAIDDTLPERCRSLERSEKEALGYGPPCECGERGLAIGESSCQECPADEI